MQLIGSMVGTYKEIGGGAGAAHRLYGRYGTYKGIGGGAGAAHRLYGRYIQGDRGRGWCSSSALW